MVCNEKAYQKNYRERHKRKFNKYQRDWHRSHPEYRVNYRATHAMICLTHTIKAKLDSLKMKNETFDELIKRLLEEKGNAHVETMSENSHNQPRKESYGTP